MAVFFQDLFSSFWQEEMKFDIQVTPTGFQTSLNDHYTSGLTRFPASTLASVTVHIKYLPHWIKEKEIYARGFESHPK